MSCQNLSLQISAYLDEELANLDRIALEAHLGSCLDCQKHLTHYQQGRFWLKQVCSLQTTLLFSRPLKDFSDDILAQIHPEMLSDLQFSSFLDGEYSSSEAQQVSEHLQNCTACQQEYQIWKTTQHLLQTAKPDEEAKIKQIDLSSKILQTIQEEQSVSSATAVNEFSEHLGARISAYLDKELSPSLQKAYDLHCQGCKECAQQVTEMRETIRFLQKVNPSTIVWKGTAENIPLALQESMKEFHEQETLPLALENAYQIAQDRRKFFVQNVFLPLAAIFLALAALISAPWNRSQRTEVSRVSTSKNPLLDSELSLDQQQNILVTQRMTRCQTLIQTAFARLPQHHQLQDQSFLTQSIEQVEQSLQENQRLLKETGLRYNPYEGDLHLLKALLSEWRFALQEAFLSPTELESSRRVLKQQYEQALHSYSKPLARSQELFPLHLFRRQLAEAKSLENRIKALKEIVLQLEKEIHQNPF